jgi:anti-sigma factor (TIGR02949 family)
MGLCSSELYRARAPFGDCLRRLGDLGAPAGSRGSVTDGSRNRQDPRPVFCFWKQRFSVKGMIALKKTDDCSLFARIIEPYVDGELDPAHAAGLEVHVLECPMCSERVGLARAVRNSLKRAAAAQAVRAPEAVRERVAATIAKMGTTGGAGRGAGDHGSSLLPRRSAMAAATIAGFLCAMGAAHLHEKAANDAARVSEAPPPIASASATLDLDGVLDDLVALHRRPPRPETTNPDEVARFDLDVGVPVRRPALPTFEARFTGARLYATHKARAALLQYTINREHRVSLYVFDPTVLKMKDAAGLRRRTEGELAVYVGQRDGYSIAAAERSGIGVALATDLDSDQCARLASEALLQ